MSSSEHDTSVSQESERELTEEELDGVRGGGRDSVKRGTDRKYTYSGYSSSGSTGHSEADRQRLADARNR